jgi:hypothetical protein
MSSLSLSELINENKRLTFYTFVFKTLIVSLTLTQELQTSTKAGVV